MPLHGTSRGGIEGTPPDGGVTPCVSCSLGLFNSPGPHSLTHSFSFEVNEYRLIYHWHVGFQKDWEWIHSFFFFFFFNQWEGSAGKREGGKVEGSSRTELTVLLSSSSMQPQVLLWHPRSQWGDRGVPRAVPQSCVCSPQSLALLFILFLVLLTILWKVRMFLVLPEMLT